MMKTRKADDRYCEVDTGFDCLLTGKAMDLKSRSAKAGAKLNAESTRFNWVKI